MDTDKLISLVYENRCLWDLVDKSYHNRDIARRAWEKVAAEMNTSCEAAKTKWRGLRDTFRREWSKIPKQRGGVVGGPAKQSKWAHFKSLEFLKGPMRKRKLEGNVTSETTTCEDDNENSTPAVSPQPDDPLENEENSETQTDESQFEQYETYVTTPSQTFGPPHKKIAKMNNAATVEKLVMLEKIQMFKERNCTCRNEDSDYHFLLSLLPFLKKIPEQRKMIVRTKLQQVFCDEDLLQQQQTIHHPQSKRGISISACGSSTNESCESENSTQALTQMNTVNLEVN